MYLFHATLDDGVRDSIDKLCSVDERLDFLRVIVLGAFGGGMPSPVVMCFFTSAEALSPSNSNATGTVFLPSRMALTWVWAKANHLSRKRSKALRSQDRSGMPCAGEPNSWITPRSTFEGPRASVRAAVEAKTPTLT